MVESSDTSFFQCPLVRNGHTSCLNLSAIVPDDVEASIDTVETRSQIWKIQESRALPRKKTLTFPLPMARTHSRSPSLGPLPVKRQKTTHDSAALCSASLTSPLTSPDADPTPYFAPDVLSQSSISSLNSAYNTNEPFKYALVEKLFQDDLLKKVKDECLSELSFTEKETDIYKVGLLVQWTWSFFRFFFSR